MKIRKEACGSDFKLAFIGDGPMRAALEQEAEKMGIGEEIVFVGKVPNEEIKNYCHAADLFLFSSLSETQGIVLLESMAAGTPVLAVRGTGTEDVVVNGMNGYMTDVSEMGFADKLMDILEKKEIDLLRQGALLTARNYSCEEIARQAALVYAQAAYNRKGRDRMKYGNRNRRKDMVYSG
ncbi:MAG: glycosyltransferase, partial [Lachnospiraceae bacterium]|nr:glycosyltransferase [Lachnospiraceae bacterium]